MSVIQYPEALNTPNLQVWNNAAFDNGESEDSTALIVSWSPVKPIFVNRSESFESVSSKENQSPLLENSSVSVKTPIPIKPLQPNIEEGVRDEKKIDKEIEEIEKEICRLSSRLEALKIEKLEKNAKVVEKRGRVVPAKFMEQKQSVKNTDSVKKIEETLQLSARTKVQRRGLSLGPSEIAAGARRGVSLGPSEIVAGMKSRQVGKQEITPVQPIQNRRKSCFWKLQDIDEEKVTKERRKSFSVGPKSRKTITKTQDSRQVATTMVVKKAVKKEDGVVNSIQPKKLFGDGEKSVPAKKPLRPGRVVASRYNQSTVQSIGNSALRKRSLPENDKDESKNCDKKRSLSVGNSHETLPEIEIHQGTESRVKKRWEIPGEIVVCKNLEDDKLPHSITAMPDLLPRIRTARCMKESPRDSGPAKRVVDLIGRISYFCNDEEVEPAVCQALSFVEEDDEEN
ncbi:unnamed protein product [Ilex paraguariensis]|uniref:Uncharacterized protein n=1 Tax=Ilex paraguariensis TaxID=185542 RepID=A0ABC8R986_9AQUA